jgi:cytochrome c556
MCHHNKEQQQEAVDLIQEHFNAVGIQAKHTKGHKNTIKTMLVWEGGDDYKQAKAKMHEAIKALNEIKARGHIDTKYGEIKVRIVGGGRLCSLC